MWLIFGLYVWMAQCLTKFIGLFAHNANAKNIVVARVLGSMASSPVAIAKCDGRTLPEAAACWVRCRTFCVAGEDLSYREALWTQAALNATPARAGPLVWRRRNHVSTARGRAIWLLRADVFAEAATAVGMGGLCECVGRVGSAITGFEARQGPPNRLARLWRRPKLQRRG